MLWRECVPCDLPPCYAIAARRRRKVLFAEKVLTVVDGVYALEGDSDVVVGELRAQAQRCSRNWS
jgi:hypothetical protein